MSLAFWITTLISRRFAGHRPSPSRWPPACRARARQSGRRFRLHARHIAGISPRRCSAWPRCCMPAPSLSPRSNTPASPICCSWPGTRSTSAVRWRSTRRRPRRSDLRVVCRRVAVNLLNPSCSIFSSPSCRSSSAPTKRIPLIRMGELSGAFMAATFVVFALYWRVRRRGAPSCTERPRVLAWLRRSFAAAFGALAVRLAFAER